MNTMSATRERPVRPAATRVGVMGLGYVGLAEAVEFARAGFTVTGFDVDAERVAHVRAARSYLVDVTDEQLAEVVHDGRLHATGDFGELAETDAILICVPTPLGKTKAPDLSYIVSAVDAIRPRLRRGHLVVLESTTYPGTTSEIVRSALESSGLSAGRDFSLGFSPERINPGDRRHPPTTIPRIVGGVTPRCAEHAAALYRTICPEVVTVSCTEAAEMVKLLENTFRAVNIGLANELALLCRALGLDVWEIIAAAATKPFGFMPFYPGPGLGGHCIPVDPLYLSWKARVNGFEPRFIDLAHQVNSAMPRVVVAMVADALNERGRSPKGSTILVLGVSYKAEVNDTRESPALDIIAELSRRGATVLYHDPYVARVVAGGQRLASVPLSDDLVRAADCVLILTDHAAVDYKSVVEAATLVVDTRNATAGLVEHRDRIVRL
jgi:UDP-N-acetyl-D-glucosamine dehydrogenase